MWILFPWNFKILYGIVSDTASFSCFEGGSKRVLLITFSFVQLVSLVLICLFNFESSQTLLYLIVCCSLCGAFLDVVIDGITCVEQRKDLKYGSQDLNTWAWVFQGLGAIVGAGLGGLIAEYGVPRHAFVPYAIVVLACFICSFMLSPTIEKSDDAKHSKTSQNPASNETG